ncbi:MAG: hypothetical protein RR654_10930, partial [Oscillospiraceae bacterium]
SNDYRWVILRSKTQKDSLVILTEWSDKNNNPVIAAVHLNKNGGLELSNEIASTYGKENITSLLGKSNENLLYTKNNESITQLLSNRRTVPEAKAEDTLITHYIPQRGKNVKDIDNGGNSV